MLAWHYAQPYEELRLCSPLGVTYKVMGCITPDRFNRLSPIELSVLRETVACLYLYGQTDNHNRKCLRATLRRFMGPDVDPEDHATMRDLHNLLSPETDG